MFNYQQENKTPTINQVKAIINYMKNDILFSDNLNQMINFKRISDNVIFVNINNGHFGSVHKVVFDEDTIVQFTFENKWMS